MARGEDGDERDFALEDGARGTGGAPDDATLETRTTGLAVVGSGAIELGTRVGRYVVLESIGSGAGGSVFRAFDPELSRHVALKLIESAKSAGADADAWRQHVVREAQALAQLSHPNVVAVHDVGVFDTGVFIAMELVEGTSLRDWVRQQRPGVDAIVKAYLDAGAGLAAAHEAGLVHRDFKPANVGLGTDGRVRVLDFGLAKVVDEPEEPPSGPTDISDISSRSALVTPMTVVGSILGTPGYMAPEQHIGAPADARSDQFAFCVALFEALAGSRPFRGASLDELQDQKQRGRVAASSLRRVPWRLRSVIVRGLRPSPPERYESMAALLDALRRAHSRAGTKLAAALALAAVAGVVVYSGIAPGPEQAPPCDGVADQPLVWTDAKRKAVSQSFRGTGAPLVAERLATLDRAMTGIAADVQALRVDVCEATYVRRSQSEALMDARSRCVDRTVEKLELLIERFAAHATPSMVRDSFDAARDLGDVARCNDSERLQRGLVPLPAEPGAAARVKAMQDQLARAEVLSRTGGRDEASALAADVLSESRALGFAPTTASAYARLAALSSVRGDGEAAADQLRRGLEAAGRARDPRQVADLYVNLVDVVGTRLAKPEEAAIVARAADVAIRLAGDPPDLRGELDVVLGALALADGDIDKALAHLMDHERIVVEQHGAEAYEAARAYSNVGGLLLEAGDYEASRERLEHALTILDRDVGDTDMTSAALVNLGLLHSELGQWARARDLLRRALRIDERILGADSPDLHWSLNGLGYALLELGDTDAAWDKFDRVRDIESSTVGPEHPDMATTLTNLARVRHRARQYAAAEELYAQALAIANAQAGDPTISAGIELERAMLEMDQGACTRLDELRRARDVLVDGRGEEHPRVAWATTQLGRCLFLRGDHEAAVATVARARDVLETLPNKDNAAHAAFVLARATESLGGPDHRARAQALARQAKDMYAGFGAARRAEFEAVASWLARHSDAQR